MAALCVARMASFWDGAMHTLWLCHLDQGYLSPKSKSERYFWRGILILISPASLKIAGTVS